MDNHRSHADGFHKDDIEQGMSHRIGISHKRSPELDDGGLAAKATNPTHCFNECVGFRDRFQRMVFHTCSILVRIEVASH